MSDEPEKKKRKKAVPTTARTLGLLRKEGWTAEVVERRVPKSFVTIDLFGCVDIIACRPGLAVGTPGSIMAVQCTTSNNMAARITKSKAEPRLRIWLLAGGQFSVWGWVKKVQYKHGKSTGRMTWQVRRTLLTLKDLDGK